MFLQSNSGMQDLISLSLSADEFPVCVLSAPCLGDSWISTLEGLTWLFLTTRMRSLRVRRITSVDNGQTTSCTQVKARRGSCLVPRARSLESRRCLKVFGGHSCCRAEFGSSCVSCSVQRVVAVFRALTPEGQSRENV